MRKIVSLIQTFGGTKRHIKAPFLERIFKGIEELLPVGRLPRVADEFFRSATRYERRQPPK